MVLIIKNLLWSDGKSDWILRIVLLWMIDAGLKKICIDFYIYVGWCMTGRIHRNRSVMSQMPQIPRSMIASDIADDRHESLSVISPIGALWATLVGHVLCD